MKRGGGKFGQKYGKGNSGDALQFLKAETWKVVEGINKRKNSREEETKNSSDSRETPRSRFLKFYTSHTCARQEERRKKLSPEQSASLPFGMEPEAAGPQRGHDS